MPDPLYLSLWFSTFRAEEMLARALVVMQQFPFAAAHPGVTYFAVQPISWSEPTVVEQRFVHPVPPLQAMEAAKEFAQDDYALVFEAYWELWTPLAPGDAEKPAPASAAWARQESKVTFILHGAAFDEGIYSEHGHIEIDFGLDHHFLYEELDLSAADQQRVRDNVAQLIAFIQAVEKHSRLTGRVLWSESEANLAQKLVARLQQTQ